MDEGQDMKEKGGRGKEKKWFSLSLSLSLNGSGSAQQGNRFTQFCQGEKAISERFLPV